MGTAIIKARHSSTTKGQKPQNSVHNNPKSGVPKEEAQELFDNSLHSSERLVPADYKLNSQASARRLVESTIVTDEFGVRSAVFASGCYHPSYEKILREMKVDLLRVKQPNEWDRFLLTSTDGYFLKHERVVWSRVAEKIDSFLDKLNSKKRHTFNSKLKASESLNAKIGENPLTHSEYQKWFEIYNKEIIQGKARGRANLDSNWAADKDDLQAYRLLSLRDKSTGELKGGAILRCDNAKNRVQIACAAYDQSIRDQAPGVRVFKEVMEYAKAKGYVTISHGKDNNLYGHYLSPGLFEFKASLGFEPNPTGDSEIIKVISPDKFDSNLVFIEGTRETGMNIRLLANESRSIVAPEGIAIQHSDFSEKDRIAPPPTLTDFAAAINSLSQEEALKKLKEVVAIIDTPKGDKFYHSTGVAPGVASQSKLLLGLIGFLQRSDARDFVLACAQKNGLNLARNESALSAEDMQTILLADNYLRLAALLADAAPAQSEEFLLAEVAASAELPCDIFERVSILSSRQAIASFLRACGSIEKLEEVVRKVDLIVPIKPLLGSLISTGPVKLIPVETEMSLDVSEFSQYFKPECQREGLELAGELYVALLNRPLCADHLDNFLDRYEIYFVDSAHGRAVAIMHRILGQVERIASINERFKEYFPVILKLETLLSKPESDRAKREDKQIYTGISGRDIFGSAEYARYCFSICGVDSSDIEFSGRSGSEISEQILARATREQIEAIFELALEICWRENDKRRLQEQRDVVITNFQGTTGPSSSTDAESLKRSHALVRAIFSGRGYKNDRHAAIVSSALLADGFDIDDYLVMPVGGIERAAELVMRASRSGNLDRLASAANIKTSLFQSAHAVASCGNILYIAGSDDPIIDLAPSDWGEIEKAHNHWDDSFIHHEVLICIASALANPETTSAALKLLKCLPDGAYLCIDKERVASMIAVDSARLTGQQRSEIGSQLIELQKRLYFDGSYDRRKSTIFSVLIIAEALKLSAEPFVNEFIDVVSRGDFPALDLLENVNKLRVKGDITILREEHLSRMLEAVIISHGDSDETVLSSEFITSIPIDVANLKSPNHSLSSYMSWRLAKSGRSITSDEIESFTSWVISNSTRLDAGFSLAVGLISRCNPQLQAALMPSVKEKLCDLSFDKAETFRKFVPMAHNLDPQGEKGVLESWLYNPEFIQRYDWAKHGYSEKLSEIITGFIQSADFSSRRAEHLVNFLMSHNDNEYNRFYVEELLSQTPGNDFANVSRFVGFWNSANPDDKDSFAKLQVGRALENKRPFVAKLASEGAISKLEQQLNKAGILDAAKESILSRIKSLNSYRELFLSEARAPSETERAEITDRINQLILKEHPPKLTPKEEESALIDHLENGFIRSISGSRGVNWFKENRVNLQESGIWERLVKFNSFANSAGKEMLRELLAAYSDPMRSRPVNIIHPESNNQERDHFDYFGKFDELRLALPGRGVSPERADEFLESWSKLFYFQRFEESQEADSQYERYLSVTHDLAEWSKHGEVPKLSCQRLISSSGHNADGRPLARMMLPQLKLAQMYVGGELQARAVIEVAPIDAAHGSRLGLLVEYVYEGFQCSGDSLDLFISEVRRYAEKLGISSDDVYFANLRATGYPQKLPEKYKIYRDYF
jgi:hypothetical protein